MLPVAILAGGLATRLGSLTASVPKSLVDVAGEPFVARQLRLLADQRVERVVLCVGHLGEMIRDFVGDGSRFGLDASYTFDGEVPLGTGGALRRALPLLGDAFFVLYGDSYLTVPMVDVASAFRATSGPAMMCVLRNDNRWDRSNAVYADGSVLEYCKRHAHAAMRHVDYGLSVLRTTAFEHAPRTAEFDLAELLETLARLRLLAGYEVTERFYEVGSQQGLADLVSYFNPGTSP